MPVMKPSVSAPVPTVNNMTGKTKKNMMLSVKKVKVKRVNVPA